MKPITQESSLQAIACEIMSAISSINSPTPAECSTEDITHSLEHLNAALDHVQMLQRWAGFEEEKEKERKQFLRQNNIAEICVDSLCHELGVDWLKQPLATRNALEKEILDEIGPSFLGAPMTDDMLGIMKSAAKAILSKAITCREIY